MSTDKQEEARLYAESKMQEGWDRNDAIMIGVFYKHFTDFIFQQYDTAYNKAIADAIESIKQKALISIDDKAFFKKFGTYHYPYCSLISHLELLIKPSQSPNQ